MALLPWQMCEGNSQAIGPVPTFSYSSVLSLHPDIERLRYGEGHCPPGVRLVEFDVPPHGPCVVTRDYDERTPSCSDCL